MIRDCTRCGRRFETDRDYHSFCWPCFRQERANGRWTDEEPSSWRKPVLDQRFLRDAIILCHPDRHPGERAKTANAVTATLLELLHAKRRTG